MVLASRTLLSVCLVVAIVTATCWYIAVSPPAANDSRLRLAANRGDSSDGDIPPAFSNMINPLALMYQQNMPVRHSYYVETSNTPSSISVPPVHVLVSVEALCIDSKHFFRDQLMTTFNALPHGVVDWKIIPFGNARMPTNRSSHTPTCQHGFAECDANTYEQCAIHLYPNPIRHIPYLACLFETLPMGHRDDPFDPWTGLEPCAHDNHLEFDRLKQCHEDPLLVWKLNHRASIETPSQHTHVPWVEIDGMHVEDIDEEKTSLLQEVCNIYRSRGGHTAGCSKFESEVV